MLVFCLCIFKYIHMCSAHGMPKEGVGYTRTVVTDVCELLFECQNQTQVLCQSIQCSQPLGFINTSICLAPSPIIFFKLGHLFLLIFFQNRLYLKELAQFMGRVLKLLLMDSLITILVIIAIIKHITKSHLGKKGLFHSQFCIAVHHQKQ